MPEAMVLTPTMTVLLLGVLVFFISLPQRGFAQVPPNLASDVTITQIKTDSAVASWTMTTGAFDNYRYTINPSAGVVFNPASPLNKNNAFPTTAISGLTIGTRYTLSVMTVKGNTDGTAKTKVFNTQPAPVNQPKIKVENVGTTTAKLSWDPVTQGTFDNYVLSISPPDPGGDVMVPGTVARGTETANLANLTAGTSYTVTMKTRYGTEESVAVSYPFKTRPSPVKLSSMRTSSLTSTSATLNWDAATPGSVDNYLLSINPTAGGATVSPSTVPGAQTTAKLQSLTPGTTYTITLSTRYGTRDGASIQYQVKTKPGDVTLSSIRVTALTSTSATLSWDAVTMGSFDRYKVSIQPTVGGVRVDPNAILKGTHTTQLKSLTAGVQYTVLLQTVWGTLESVGTSYKFTTKPNKVPTNLRFSSVEAGSAKVAWDAASGIFDSYVITIAPTTNGENANPATVQAGAAALTTNLVSLAAGTQYSVAVQSSANGVASDAVTGTFWTKPGFVTQGSIGIENLAETSATLIWGEVTVGTFNNYVITISPTTNGETVDPSSVPRGNTRRTNLKKLLAGTQYTIRIATKRGTQESSAATYTFTTKPNIVNAATITFTNMQTTTGTVSWTAASGSFVEYVIRITPTTGGAKVDPETVAKGTQTTSLKLLTPGTAYTITIRTRAGTTESNGASKEVKTRPVAVAKSTITVDALTAISGTLRWSPVSQGTVQKYLVTLSPNAGGAEAFPDAPNVGIETTGLRNLTPGTKYTATIITNYGGLNGAAITYDFTTLPPDVASALTITAIATTSATVSWTKTNGNFEFYQTAISPNSEGEKVDRPKISKSTDNPETTLSDLKPGREYTVRVSTLLGTVPGVAQSKTFKTKDCQTGYFREPGATSCKECHCIGTCFPTAGCSNSACSKGWLEPPQCQKKCAEDYFGYGCKDQCHCKPGDKCDHISGSCPKGCHPDYFGADCQQLLPGLSQTPTLSNPFCSNVTINWKAFNLRNGDASDFPISRYLLQFNINGTNTWQDTTPFYDHEVNVSYSHTVTGLQSYTAYRFRVRTDANFTITLPTISYVALEGRPSPVTTPFTPPCIGPTIPPLTTTTTTTTTTTPAPGAPTIPVNLTLVPSVTTIVVSWEPPASKDHTSYTLFYHRTAIGDCFTDTTISELKVDLSGVDKSHTIRNLDAWSTYKVSLRANNQHGTGSLTFRTTQTKETTPIGKCYNLTDSGRTASTFDLSFEPPPCAGRKGALKQYRVRIKNTATTAQDDYLFSNTQVTYKVQGLNPDTAYKVSVSYINTAILASPFSDEADVKTEKWTVIVTAKPDYVEVQWQALYPKPPGTLNQYKVEYWEDKAPIKKIATSTSQTTLKVLNVPAGIIKFQVTGTSTNWEVKSEITTVDTRNTAPSQPTSLAKTTATTNGITVTWGTPVSSATTVTHYKVYYQFTKTGLAGGQSNLKYTTGTKEVAASLKSHNLTPLDPATTYRIDVSAKNAIGYGDPASSTLSTHPGTPPDPKKPEIAETTTTTFKLTLTLPTSTVGPISRMAIAIQKDSSQSNRRRRAVTSLCTETPAKELVPSDFKDNTATVVLGDGKSDSTNPPLAAGTKYTICYKVDSTYEGETKSAGTTFTATTQEGTNIVMIIIIVVVILVIIIIIIIIVVVVLLIRKKRREAAWDKPLDTLGLDLFDETMYNIKPYGKWSDVHRVGEPRFIEHVKDPLNADASIIPLEHEYHKLPRENLYTWEHAMEPENKHKNRFESFLPYDHSRVVLNMPGGHDYINANYIDGYKKPRAYIAAASPFNTETVADFWHMVCQENTQQIVMLCLPVEEGIFKCEEYWPDSTKTYGGVKVQLLSTLKYSYFTIRTFEVVPNPHSKKTITQFHFTGWPCHGIPEDPIPFLDFIYKVRSMSQPGAGPVVVHCGTGISRTSVYIAVDSLIKEGRKRGQVNVFDFCSEMRQNRFGMVRTLKQYLFIYDTLYEALLSPDSVMDIDMRAAYHALISKNPATGHTNLYEQFKIFRDYTPMVDETKCRTGLQPANKRKNRFPNIVPPDEFRPKLKTPGGHNRTEYINALIMDSYTRKDAFFVTQTPLAETVVDFWKLVYDYKISTIVMLHDRTYKEESSAEYWPKTLGSVRYDPFVVTLRTFVKEREYVISRTMDVNNQIRPSEKAHEVKQFQLDGDWLMYDHVPKTRESVLQLMDAVFENRKKTADHPETPILVHCIDGAGRSGLFCCLMNLVERMQIDRYADVFHCMKHLKRRRSQFVDDLDQYRFCYKTLWDFINTRMVRLPVSMPKNARNGMNGTASGDTAKRRDKRHLELTLAANDLNNYDYTLSVA